MKIKPNEHDLNTYIGKWFTHTSGAKFQVIEIDSIGHNYTKKYTCVFEDGYKSVAYGRAIKDGYVKYEPINENKIPLTEKKDNVVLAIPDIHLPFEHKNALAFCKRVYEEYGCDQVVILGDFFDNNGINFHDKDPDSMGIKKEYETVLEKTKKWHKAFPNAKVVLGNHGSLPLRRMFSAGLPAKWLKSYADLFETPTWEYADYFNIDGVTYIHGDAGMAKTRMTTLGASVVQGHCHTKSSIEYWVGSNHDMKFAVQLGALIDKEAYAFRYAKFSMPVHMNVAVIKNGKHVVVEYMKEEENEI